MSNEPCKVRDGRFIEPCVAMIGAFDGSSAGKGRALFMSQYINIKTGEQSRSFVVLRMGDHIKNGVALNVCPFCGERIDAPFQDEEAEPTTEAA